MRGQFLARPNWPNSDLAAQAAHGKTIASVRAPATPNYEIRQRPLGASNSHSRVNSRHTKAISCRYAATMPNCIAPCRSGAVLVLVRATCSRRTLSIASRDSTVDGFGGATVVCGSSSRCTRCRAALHPMKRQGPIQPLPEIAVLDRHHLAMILPSPIVFAPIGQAVAQAASDVFARRDQCHERRLLECFQSADYGQQFEPLTAQIGLGIPASSREVPSSDCRMNRQSLAGRIGRTARDSENKRK